MIKLAILSILMAGGWALAEATPDLSGATASALEAELKKIDTTTDLNSAVSQTEIPSAPEVKAEAKADPSSEAQPVFKEPQKAATASEAPTSNIWTKMVGSLFLVLSIIGGIVWLFKRTPAFKKQLGKAPMIEVMCQMPIGPRKSLAVVKTAGEAALIGITEQNITLIKTLTLLDEEPVGQAKFGKSLKSAMVADDDQEEFAMKGLKDIVRLQFHG